MRLVIVCAPCVSAVAADVAGVGPARAAQGARTPGVISFGGADAVTGSFTC